MIRDVGFGHPAGLTRWHTVIVSRLYIGLCLGVRTCHTCRVKSDMERVQPWDNPAISPVRGNSIITLNQMVQTDVSLPVIHMITVKRQHRYGRINFGHTEDRS